MLNGLSTPSYFKARLRSKSQLTIPKKVRELLGVNPGDELVFYLNEQKQVVIDRQRDISPDQAWFWTGRWQQMEQEAEADIDAGRVHRYANVDEAIAALERLENASN